MEFTQIIPAYEIKELICESYPHILYRANHRKDGRAVVIKTLLNKYPKKETIAALRREFHITQSPKTPKPLEIKHASSLLLITLNQ